MEKSHREGTSWPSTWQCLRCGTIKSHRVIKVSWETEDRAISVIRDVFFLIVGLKAESVSVQCGAQGCYFSSDNELQIFPSTSTLQSFFFLQMRKDAFFFFFFYFHGTVTVGLLQWLEMADGHLQPYSTCLELIWSGKLIFAPQNNLWK